MKCLNFYGRWYRKRLKGSGHGHAGMDILSEAKRPPEDYVLLEGLGDTYSLKSPGMHLLSSLDIAVFCWLRLIVGEAVTDFSSLIAMGMKTLPLPIKPQRPGGGA